MSEAEGKIKLTQFAHGAGCGCKIAPQVLQEILSGQPNTNAYDKLIVGNQQNDDAAVYDLGSGVGLISTTDFFMPILDDAFDFGRVASANAISDVYAMGGKPILALAVLGWPVDKLPASLAKEVIEGSRSICAEANIPLAGGHSIDTSEPMFGLSVNGLVSLSNLKQNSTANEGDTLFFTKAIGTGIMATALKRGKLKDEHLSILVNHLTSLNKIGSVLGEKAWVTAMTDVTGFGLLGHLIEMCEGSNLSVDLFYNQVKKMPGLDDYIAQSLVPDATYRNWNAYSVRVEFDPSINMMEAFQLLPDPQTNGGLLFSVKPSYLKEIVEVLEENGLMDFLQPVGIFKAKTEKLVQVKT